MKKNPYIDLHIHSIASDGRLTPTELVDKALKLGLKAIAITDHDSIAGVKQAQNAAQEKKGKVEIVSGVEVGCDEVRMGLEEIHVLGYFFDPDAEPLNALLEKTKRERIKQKKKIIKRLQELGFEITFEEVAALVKGEMGRPHVAQVLLKEYPKEFSSIRDVFQKYIESGKPAYVEKEHLTSIKEAVDAIVKSGGVAVLAHPAVFKEKKMLELIDYFIKCGGKGIETDYPYAKLYVHEGFDKEKEEKTIAMLKKIAREKNLFETGGSDFHGGDRLTVINEMKVPYAVLGKMKNKIKI